MDKKAMPVNSRSFPERCARVFLAYARVWRAILAGLIKGSINKEYVYSLIEKKRVRKDSLRISLFVTSVCSYDCPHCIMGHLRRAAAGYHMSLEEIQRFIAASEASGYRFDIMLTGGEPLLWNNFARGARMLRMSRSCDTLRLFTNAFHIEPLTDTEIARCFDEIKITSYRGNKENIRALKEKVVCVTEVLEGERFYENPLKPVPGTLPAQCLNSELLLFRDNVYACPHSASIACGNGSKIKLCNPLKPGFLAGLKKIKKQQQEEICTFCISNQRVREKVAKVENVGSTGA